MTQLEHSAEDGWIYDLVRERGLGDYLDGGDIRWCRWIRLQIRSHTDPFGDPDDFYQEVLGKIFLQPGYLWAYNPAKGGSLERFFITVVRQTVGKVALSRQRGAKKRWVCPLGSTHTGIGIRIQAPKRPFAGTIFRGQIDTLKEDSPTFEVSDYLSDPTWSETQREFEYFLAKQRDSEGLLLIYHVKTRQESETALNSLDSPTRTRLTRRLQDLAKTFFT